MKRLLPTLILSLLFANFSNAVETPNELATKAAEITYFSQQNATTFAQWVQNLTLTPDQKKEVLTYLEKNKLSQTVLPKASWKWNSTEVKIYPGHDKVTIDFSALDARKEISVNGKAISGKGANFADLEKKVAASLSPKPSALWQFALPTAQADDNLTIAWTSIVLHTGFGLSKACSEADLFYWPSCHLTPVTYSILHDLSFNPKKDHLLDFQCTADGHFNSLSVQKDGEPVQKMTTTHDAGGNANNIKIYKDEDLQCSYNVSGTKLLALPDNRHPDRGDDICDGSSTDDFHTIRSLNKGNDIYMLSQVPAPLQQLEKCCNKSNKSCQDKMKEIVSATTPRASTGASAPAQGMDNN